MINNNVQERRTKMNIEITIIANPNIGTKAIEEFKQIISSFSDIKSFEDEGIKKLAYPIHSINKEYEEGRYLFWTATIESEKVLNSDEEKPFLGYYQEKLDHHEDVLRYLIVREFRRNK